MVIEIQENINMVWNIGPTKWKKDIGNGQYSEMFRNIILLDERDTHIDSSHFLVKTKKIKLKHVLLKYV